MDPKQRHGPETAAWTRNSSMAAQRHGRTPQRDRPAALAAPQRERPSALAAHQQHDPSSCKASGLT
eukprot:946420-Prymnesium_polylepis.1